MIKSYFSLLMVLLFVSIYSFGQNNSAPLKIGEEFDVNISSKNAYRSPVTGFVFQKDFYSKGSSYVKLYFKNFDLAEGDYVEISNPQTAQKIIYAGGGKLIKEGTETISDFWSASIFGDEAQVKLFSNGVSTHYGFDIVKVAYGFSEEELKKRAPMAICGSDDKERAICHEGTEMYEKSKAVCRLVLGGSGLCTGWLLGSEGHIMTNNHCIGSASAARDVEFQFMYQNTGCSGSGNAQTDVVAETSELVKTNSNNDYALVKLPVNPTDKYGYLSLRSTAPKIGERIYIPQHPGGRRKELAVKDDKSSTGLGKITGNGHRSTYMTDTEGGSSGSPVLSYDDNLVIVLHNTGGCDNGGMKNTDIIEHIGNDLPNDAVDGGGVTANFTISVGKSCDGKISFKDQSSKAIKWSWDFGDGNNSTDQNPIHTYKKSGNFKVVLTVEDNSGKQATKEGTVQIVLVESPEAEGVEICKNETANLEAKGNGGTLKWYDAATGGNLLGTGTSYTTEELTTTTSFYVEEGEDVPAGNVGPKDNTAGDGGMHNEENYGLIFTAEKNIVLKSLKVYAESAGEREIAIMDKQGGTVLVSKKVNIDAGEQKIMLNLEIPAGAGRFIQIINTPVNLFRNSSGANFPYSFDNLVSITGSNAENYYYYFYDWEVQEIGCSSSRTKVEVAVKKGPDKPSIKQKDNDLLLKATTGHEAYQWYLDGEPLQGATKEEYLVNKNGKYTVEVTDKDGCKTMSDEVSIVNVGIKIINQPVLKVYPNPVVQTVYIKGIENAVPLKVIDLVGKELKNTFGTSVNVSDLEVGTYILLINNDKKIPFIKSKE